MNSVRRKLRALNFPNENPVDFTDDNNFRSLVQWLEDQFIRLYTIEDRQPLRSENINEWIKAFEKYLTELSCPFPPGDTDRLALLDWLLAQAISLEYTDKADQFSKYTSDKIANAADSKQQQQKQAGGASQNPLDKLDFNSEDMKRGITELATLLRVQMHPNHLITLEACCQLIEDRLSPEAMRCAQEQQKPQTQSTQVPLDQFPLGFDTGDPVMNNVARVMRLLHLKETRELQTNINNLIVAVQDVTADPKTDDRLGKVGIYINK